MNGKSSKQRSKSSEESSGGGGWQVTFSGFVLIMLCFFIMLSSFASIEAGKVARFVKSFVESMSVLTGGISLNSGKIIVPSNLGIVDIKSSLAKIFSDVKREARKAGLEGYVEVLLPSGGGMIIRLSDIVLFKLGDAEIVPDAFVFLEKVGFMISGDSHRIRIEGHTDNLPIRTARFPSNWELSTARAVNVLRYFTEKIHIPPDRISAVGFGEFRPAFPNDSPANRGRNRRVEIVLEAGPAAAGSGEEKKA